MLVQYSTALGENVLCTERALIARSGVTIDRHRLPWSAYAGCQSNSAEKRLDLFLYYCIALFPYQSDRQREFFVWGTEQFVRFALEDLGNEEEGEGSTLTDFTEISSFQSRMARGRAWTPTAWEQPRSPRLPAANFPHAVCPHWTATSPHQTVPPLRTHILNFNMQA